MTLRELPAVEGASELVTEVSFNDPNGERQSASALIPVWPSTVMVGLRGGSWVTSRGKTTVQAVTLDDQGRYAVALGATQPEGVPLDLFTSGTARWLAVTVDGVALAELFKAGVELLDGVGNGFDADAEGLVGTGGQAAATQMSLNFSRDMEREADRIGWGVFAQAGYAPAGMARMFEQMHKLSNGLI